MPEWLEQALAPAPSDKTGFDHPRDGRGEIPTMRATSRVQQQQMGEVRKAKSQARNSHIVGALRGLSIGGMLAEGAEALHEKDYKGAAVAGAFAALPLAHNVKGMTKLLAELGREGGATLHATGDAFKGTAYMVADPAFTIKTADRNEILAFLSRKDVRQGLAEGKLIGKWTDGKTGITEINLSDPVTHKPTAEALGRERGERALGHVKVGEYQGDIHLKGSPVPGAMKLAESMRTGPMMPRVKEIAPRHGKLLAETYAGLPKHDPAAAKAYESLNKEVAGQLEQIKKAGYKIEFVDHDPYKSSQEMMDDVRDNQTLKVFKTPAGGAHPYMTAEQNDAFRGVHDFIAHAGGGNQFGAVGEENAYRMHAATLSPEARRALATETRGQNSWVNFGPNSHLPAKERPFAEQKAALFPEHMTGDYPEMTRPGPMNPMTGEPLTHAGRAPGTRSPEARVQPGDPIRPPVDFQGRKVPAGRQMPAEPKPPIAPIPDAEIERGSKIADLTKRIERKHEQLQHANGEYADQLKQDVQIMAQRLDALRKDQLFKHGEGPGGELKPVRIDEPSGGQALADSIPGVVQRAVKHVASTGRTLPLDVSINPPGVDASRPPLYRPTKADLSVLDPVKRRFKSVYTPAAERGLKENPIGAAWYDMSPLERAFIDESPTGRQDFKMFMDLMGPTSAGTNVPMNMRQASFWYQQWKLGKLTPEALLNRGVQIPKGYANRLRIAESLEKVLFKDGLNPMSTPKTYRYSGQLGGTSWGGLALDRHVGRNVGVEGMMDGGKSSSEGFSRAFPEAGYKKTGKVSSSPDNNHYAAIEDAGIDEAGKMGVHPAVYQAAGWVGNAAKTGVDDARHPLEILNEKLEDTAKRYGHKSGSDALRKFIRGETPLWALGGITSGAGMMYDEDE